MSRTEKIALAACAAVSLALRYFAFFRYRFDSDEPQHLHVAWGWTAGLVQYRDFFDNHAPLFHILTAPLLAALGERSDILFYMRAAMLPLFAVVIVCTYLLATRLYSTSVALWSAVVLSLLPPFFLKSLEYRTDNLWNTVWCIALLVFLSGPPSPLRWFIGGLVLGTAMTVSLKTTLLAVTLAGAALILRWLLRDRTPVASSAAAAVAGLAVMPAIVSAYFFSVGAFNDFIYCVFTFNTLIERARPHTIVAPIAWPFLMAAVVIIARRSTSRVPARLFCAIAFAVFVVTLISFWPLISPRDMLPVMPLGIIFIVAAFDRRGKRIVWSTAAAAVLAGSLFYYAEGFRDHTTEFVTAMNQVLRLTRPGEWIMDLKGETIYRPRPYYNIFEMITTQAMRKGLLLDRVPERVVARRCYVAQADARFFPPRARAFLNANFLDLGRLRAAGQWIRPDGTFTIAVPGPYVVVDVTGLASGSLDGSPGSGPRELAGGAHRFDRANPRQRVAVLWAPAFARGFSPFHLQDRDFVIAHRREARGRAPL
ncbi:MAG TPA: glycosyltransferase family 39 protein [Thermoanaerobaculia bacterium]|nr:glycosyltransferase family 39 protein [Thermoanaerobaculia bacterium]